MSIELLIQSLAFNHLNMTSLANTIINNVTLRKDTHSWVIV